MLRIAALVLLICSAATAGEGTLPWPAPDAKRVDELKADLKHDLSDEFRITSVGPWVIATDMDASESQRIIHGTIGNCASAIQRQLFTKKARSEPVKVYLFKDAESYSSWNKKLFGERPSSIFGYFSRAHNSLVMNIGTGGGTLVHEMVHAMAEEDFPDIPAWMNEGLGSLYEACAFSPTGRAIGVINWRLKGLKDDMDAGKEARLKDLIGMKDSEFYGERQSANYAAMRYFLQWMQDQGKLETFYVAVRDKKGADAQKSLLEIFGNKMTIEELHTKVFTWVRQVAAERYPKKN